MPILVTLLCKLNRFSFSRGSSRGVLIPRPTPDVLCWRIPDSSYFCIPERDPGNLIMMSLYFPWITGPTLWDRPILDNSILWPVTLRITLLMVLMMDLYVSSLSSSLIPENFRQVRLEYCSMSSNQPFSPLTSSSRVVTFERIFSKIIFLNASFWKMTLTVSFTLFSLPLRSIFLNNF